MANPHVSDYKQVSEQIVLDLINNDNALTLSLAEVRLNAPVAQDGTTRVGVTVRPVPGAGYGGSKEVFYNRVLLSDIPTLANGEDKEVDIALSSDVLDFINTKYGVNLGFEDVTVNGADLGTLNSPIVQEYDVPLVFTITAKAASFVWAGEITLSVMRVRQKLGSIVTVLELDGLYAPLPWPTEDYLIVAPDGSMRQTPDGSIRIFA